MLTAYLLFVLQGPAICWYQGREVEVVGPVIGGRAWFSFCVVK